MVLPIMRAPASSSFCTAAAFFAAGAWLASQSGLPQPVTRPAMSKMSLVAKVRPWSGPPAAPAISKSPCGQKAPVASAAAEKRHVSMPSPWVSIGSSSFSCGSRRRMMMSPLGSTSGAA